MEIVRAQAMGMCFGVVDALEAARRVESPGNVSIHGELVHNEEVLTGLEQLGFQIEPERPDRPVPASPTVMITAHGVSDRERLRLAGQGKQILDTTCPLVLKAHEAALSLQADGFHVVVVGRADHVEVRGLIGDLTSYSVFETPEEVEALPHDRLGVIAQTTTSSENVAAVLDRIRELHPRAELRFVDTVCQPTKDRQLALEQLIPKVDAVVVVGGSNSNNTRRLAERCRERGVAAYHVQSAADLDPSWFTRCERVGLTAGTSTLDRTIDEVHERLLSFACPGLA